MKLEGKSIVVTGASSGMGQAIVELFAKEGANVIAVARRKERLDALAAALEDVPGKVIPFVGDVSAETTNEAMIDLAVKQFGRLDVLVNNAGVLDDMGPVGDLTNERFEKTLQVNLYGPMYAMRKAVHVFLGQGTGGNIINVASLGAMRTCAGAAYCASKAALVSMSKNTAYMYMPNGIRCNVIAPGAIKSEMSASIGRPNMTGYGRIQNVVACGPEAGETTHIAATALFLASDDSAYISGGVLVVDGGWNAG